MPQKSKAFTLIEVMIAIGIFATLSILIQSSWSGNYKRFQKSKIKVQAVELLQKRLVEVEAEFKTSNVEIPDGVQTGKFEDEKYKDYSWEWEAREIEIPDLSALVPTDGENTIVISVLEKFREYLNQSILEVSVSILYQRDKKAPPMKFTVPMFFVNFDQEMQLGLPSTGGGGGIPGVPNGQ